MQPEQPPAEQPPAPPPQSEATRVLLDLGSAVAQALRVWSMERMVAMQRPGGQPAGGQPQIAANPPAGGPPPPPPNWAPQGPGQMAVPTPAGPKRPMDADWVQAPTQPAEVR